ncbi:MAG: hypothetical protein IKU25_03635 [Clostridia bacterium]|nr:hypothetical protein [Clostridia bacterium]
MSSNQKTPRLKLNVWDGSDKPKRADFNYDNETLDTTLGEHLDNTEIHITSQERAKWDAPFVIGTYQGNGANTRVINLDFTPSFLIVYANLIPWSVFNKDSNKVFSYGGFSTVWYSSPGIYLGENSFTVTDTPSNAVYSNFYPCMNTSGYRYQYIAFK